MPVRKVITRRSNHFRTYIPSLKNGQPTPCESMLEGMFIRLCELSPQVRSYEVQPTKEALSVENRIERYTPDVRVHFFNGTEGWFEIKPSVRLRAARVHKRMDAAKEHFTASGRRFRVITDDWLNTEPRAKNIETLMYHRRGLLTPVELDRFQRELHRSQPKTLGALCSAIGHDDAWLLLGLGIVGVNLEQEINADIAVYLFGGHRHADFFA